MVTSFKDSIAHAKSTFQSNLSTAQRLREEAGETTPEELDPEDAGQRLEDVYEPLMGDREHHGRGTEDEENPRYISRDREDLKERKVHKLEVSVSYFIFLVLGACVLLPWNTVIVSGTYLKARLEGSFVENSYSSWVALTFTTGNLVFLALANSTQHNANLSFRILSSIMVVAVVLVGLVISTQIETIGSLFFFAFLMIGTVLLAAASSYLQNAVVALSSRFGPMYLQAILSGQGAIALAIATLQLTSALSGSTSSDTDPATIITTTEIPSQIRQAAFSFFLIIGIFSAFSAICHLLLTRLPLYRLVIQSTHTTKHHHNHPKTPPSFKTVERKIRSYGISIFYIFLVTLSVFPSITSSILSVHEGTSGGLGENWTRKEIWIPIGFMVFSAGDWIGRALPGFESMRFSSRNKLRWISIVRTGFVPLFLMCNVQTGAGSTTPTGCIQSDLIFMFLMLSFSISNGYISTLIMLSGIADESLEEDEVDIAATCLAFYLTSGLAAGSLISFPVRAAVCRCNPFV